MEKWSILLLYRRTPAITFARDYIRTFNTTKPPRRLGVLYRRTPVPILHLSSPPSASLATTINISIFSPLQLNSLTNFLHVRCSVDTRTHSFPTQPLLFIPTQISQVRTHHEFKLALLFVEESITSNAKRVILFPTRFVYIFLSSQPQSATTYPPSYISASTSPLVHSLSPFSAGQHHHILAASTLLSSHQIFHWVSELGKGFWLDLYQLRQTSRKSTAAGDQPLTWQLRPVTRNDPKRVLERGAQGCSTDARAPW